MLRWLGYGSFAVLSGLLLWATYAGKAGISNAEAWGFVSGAACVWLTVIENIWNWPVGIANSAFFVVLFFGNRLFADMSLNVLYIVLGFLGWYWWLKGGDRKTELKVSRTGTRTAAVVGVVGIAATFGMAEYLTKVKDSAPFLDALTTVLSLIAQYLLTRKLLENWLVWMTADVIYVGLYASRHLYLTAVLNAIFFAMCVAGFRQWHRTWVGLPEPAHG